MADLQDISTAALDGSTPDEKINSVIRQLNEWGRNISNESVSLIQNADDGTVRIIQGKTPFEGVYGTIYYDSTGIPRILVGLAPVDGRPGVWVSKDGQNVITLLGG